MPCPVNVAADVSGIKINLSLSFPYRPTVEDAVCTAEVAFTNYAQYALGLPASRSAFTTLAAVAYDPFSASWEIVEEDELTTTKLAPETQLYLFQAGVTEVQGEIPDPVDAQLFLATPARRSSPQPAPRQSVVAESQRVSRGTSTEPASTPAETWPGQPYATGRTPATAAPTPARETVSTQTHGDPYGTLGALPQHTARSPKPTPSLTPHVVSPISEPRSRRSSLRLSAWDLSLRSRRDYSRRPSPRSEAAAIPTSWLPHTPSPSVRRRPASPSPSAESVSLPENRGKSILQDEREKISHFDEVSLDHLRADLRREEDDFNVSIGSRSQSQQSRR